MGSAGPGLGRSQETTQRVSTNHSKLDLTNTYCHSIERDAQLLANRIALLKQEEQKTWKKIDDTKKRTNEILTLKKRNEDRIQKVRQAKLVVHFLT